MRRTILLALLAGLLASAPAGAAQERTYTGTIDGAEYRVVVPEPWNGTLLLYSHPYYPPNAGIPPGIGLANRPETETWLLQHGYALAGSDFKGRYGYTVEPALQDQIALLDWFDEHVGRPRRTIATGSSGGAGISVLLAERTPLDYPTLSQATVPPAFTRFFPPRL